MSQSIHIQPAGVTSPRRIPAYLCQKCGATADVQWKQAYTQADLDNYKQAERDLTERMPRRFSWLLMPDIQRLWDMTEGIRLGEHLRCTCARCGYSWAEPTIDRTLVDAEPTPIYDAVVDVSARVAERGVR